MNNALHYLKIVFVFFLSYSFDSFAQIPSATQNYVMESKVRVADKKTEAQLAALPVASVNRTVQYFDGLGRALQTVQWQGSPSFRDLVTPVTYDAVGREDKKYLPYAAVVGVSNGSYKESAISDQESFYVNPTIYAAPGVVAIPRGVAVSRTVFEASPLSRVLEQGAPGAVWQPALSRTGTAGRTSVLSYGSNSEVNEVRLWEVLSAGGANGGGHYPANKLYKTISKDENWVTGKAGTTEEFKNFEGKVVLKRIWETEVKSLSTYYVYDDLGNLRYVLPPAVNENGKTPISSFTENDAVFDQFIYAYDYDGRGRLVEKKIPGKGWEFIVYNTLDQVLFSQDATQRQSGKWLFNKYDAFGRVIITGIYLNSGSRLALQALAESHEISQLPLWESRDNGNANGTGTGYTLLSMPKVSISECYTLNYYDDYNFYGNLFGQPIGAGQVTGHRTRTLLTGTKSKVLGTATMLLTVNYYDEQGQVLQSKMENHLAGTDVLSNTWSFSGELVTSTRVHTVGGTTTNISNRYEYDHMGRKLNSRESINGQTEVMLSKLEYNEIGQLLNKKLHSINNEVSFLESTDFAYNERGWLKNSTSNQFSLRLEYQDGTSPQFNGNISNQLWGSTAALTNTFTYSYDKLNRLTQSVSAGLGESISYDEMGNILSLNREGYGTNNYTAYLGNRLTQISGFSNSSYSYDANGNMISDSQKNINLTYNYLNLPLQISGNHTITYTYDANGNKLRKQSSTAGITDYVKGIQYKAGGVIDFIQTEEGLARNNSGNYSYEYSLTDHLGNNRVTLYRNPSSGQPEVLQRDDYYAFGLRKSTVVSANQNKYLYNGKELQEELGQYDYGARFYDPVIGRFTTLDPLAENFPWMTSYQYASNDPIKNIDLDGLEGLFFGLNPALLTFGSSSVTPRVGPVAELARLAPENIAKAGGEFSGKTLESFKRGNATEVEQLAKNGLEKNYNPIKGTDPKTGQEGKTIPDAFKNDGKSTVEIKDVKNQSLTKQLRLQEKFSNDNGFQPELIINKGAGLSKPLKNSSFDIKTYQIAPAAKSDNTKVVNTMLIPPGAKPVQ